MISKAQIESGQYIPNAAIRELVERCVKNGEIGSWSEFTMQLGMSAHASTSVKRALGMQAHSGAARCTEWIRYDLAVNIVRALGRWPIDYGV